MPALYTSLHMETAWQEAQQGFPFKAQPLTVCAYDVDCADVADLTDPGQSTAWNIDPAHLACPWEALSHQGVTPPSWQVAQRLRAAGVAAVIVPSYAPRALAGDRNLVFWRWSSALPHKVAVIDDQHRLPRDDRSWM